MTRWALVVLAVVGLVATGLAIRPRSPHAVRVAAQERPATAALRGRIVYQRYGCALCHGADGKGGFANANAETDGKVPGVLFVKEGYTPAELRLKILDGMAAIGKADPKGPLPPYRMPGWRGQMADGEVADLVEYLLSLYPASTEEKWR